MSPSKAVKNRTIIIVNLLFDTKAEFYSSLLALFFVSMDYAIVSHKSKAAFSAANSELMLYDDFEIIFKDRRARPGGFFGIGSSAQSKRDFLSRKRLFY